jgi:hypothetical protein
MHVAVLFGNMTILVVLGVVLALMPVLAAVLFRGYLIGRKQNELENEIKKLNGDQSELVESRGGVAKVRELIDHHYRWRSLMLPASLCAVFYMAGVALGLEYIHTNDAHTPSWLFPGNILVHARLLLYTFIGVYLFNSGTLVRRVYLVDLSEVVFWGGIYRLMLSMGLAITLLPFKFSSGRVELVFFAIGFLANAFLGWVLELAMQAAGINTAKRDDFSLRMVRGINVWKDYRLEEEGVENAQNLATADVIELAVKTHYSLRTLIDWVDQAMAISRFGLKIKDLEAAGLNVSAIELAWLAPEATGGNTAVAQAIATAGKMDLELVKAQLNSLYEDALVRELWTLWQTKPEFNGTKITISAAVPPPHAPEVAAAAAAAQGTTQGQTSDQPITRSADHPILPSS